MYIINHLFRFWNLNLISNPFFFLLIFFNLFHTTVEFYYSIFSQYKNYYIPICSPFLNSKYEEQFKYTYNVPFFPMIPEFQEAYFIHSVRNVYFQSLTKQITKRNPKIIKEKKKYLIIKNIKVPIEEIKEHLNNILVNMELDHKALILGDQNQFLDNINEKDLINNDSSIIESKLEIQSLNDKNNNEITQPTQNFENNIEIYDNESIDEFKGETVSLKELIEALKLLEQDEIANKDILTESLDKKKELNNQDEFKSSEDQTIQTEQGNPNKFLVFFFHVWDPTFSDLMPQLSEIYFNFKSYLNEKIFDIIFYPINYNQDGNLLLSNIEAINCNNCVTTKMLEFIQKKFGINYSTLRFGSGSIYWLENGKYIHKWDKKIKLKDFVYRGLFGNINNYLLGTNRLKAYKTNLEINEIQKLFHSSISNYIGFYPLESNRNHIIDNHKKNTRKYKFSYHVNTQFSIYLPKPSDKQQFNFYRNIIELFQRYIRFKLPKECEVNIYNDIITSSDIKIEKAIIEYNPIFPDMNEGFNNNSLIIGNTNVQMIHSVLLSVHYKPQNQILTQWLQNIVQYWITPLNSFNYEEAIRSRKKIAILFVEEGEAWNTLINRMISYIGIIHQRNIPIRNSVYFMYADRKTYHAFFDSMNKYEIDFGIPSLILINHADRIYTQCSPKCFINIEGNWIIDYERVTALLKNQNINIYLELKHMVDHKLYSSQEMLPQSFFAHVHDENKVNEVHDDIIPFESKAITSSLLEEYYYCSEKVPIILFFYTRQCSHCIKFFSDIKNLRSTLEKDDILRKLSSIVLEREQDPIPNVNSDKNNTSSIARCNFSIMNLNSHEFYKSDISPFTTIDLIENGGKLTQTPFRDIVSSFPSVFIVRGRNLLQYSGSLDKFISWINDYIYGFWKEKSNPFSKK